MKIVIWILKILGLLIGIALLGFLIWLGIQFAQSFGFIK